MNTPRTALEECLRLAELATPGEWKVLIDGPGSKDVGTSEDGGIATCFTHGLEHDPTDAANAYLISSAINLLRTHGKALSEALGWWLPIETAPKDGAKVLLWLRAPYSRPALASWFERWSMWVEFEGEDDDSPGGIGSLVPTHWRPLPPPPTSANGNPEAANG